MPLSGVTGANWEVVSAGNAFASPPGRNHHHKQFQQKQKFHGDKNRKSLCPMCVLLLIDHYIIDVRMNSIFCYNQFLYLYC